MELTLSVLTLLPDNDGDEQCEDEENSHGSDHKESFKLLEYWVSLRADLDIKVKVRWDFYRINNNFRNYLIYTPLSTLSHWFSYTSYTSRSAPAIFPCSYHVHVFLFFFIYKSNFFYYLKLDISFFFFRLKHFKYLFSLFKNLFNVLKFLVKSFSTIKLYITRYVNLKLHGKVR